jgi:hypothetical protein
MNNKIIKNDVCAWEIPSVGLGRNEDS